ncbi:MAG: hypothetical protein WCS72_10890 [Deltaproteobacteria bacterium]
MRRVVVLAALAFAACSSGSPIIPAGFDGPVAVVPFMGVNPAKAGAGLVPLLAVASFRSDELALVDPNFDAPVPAPNLSWALTVPTLPRPSLLASGSLEDGGADLLVVAGSAPVVQVVGTWLDPDPNSDEVYGIAETLNFTPYVGAGAQILSLAVIPVPTGPPTGSPPVAPTRSGRVRLIVGIDGAFDPSAPQPDRNTSRLVVLDMVRKSDGSIGPDGPPAVKRLVPESIPSFAPVAVAMSPDNVHLYIATRDIIHDSSGRAVLGIAELDTSPAASEIWPVRGFDARNSPTTSVAAAFVGERSELAFFIFDGPKLRVYASLDFSGCGSQRDIACGVATFDPALGGLASDPAPPGPPGSLVPRQSYRTPFNIPSLPLAMGIAHPAELPGSVAPSAPFGSQVCYSPAVAGVTLPLCPNVTEIPGGPPFNLEGFPQPFMVQAPSSGQLWTSVVGLVTAIDGLAYVQDLGRYGPVNALAMLSDPTSRTSAVASSAVGPLGPYGNSAFFGFPPGTAAIGLWQDHPTGAGTPPTVVNATADLVAATIVWPGFTRDDHWLVSYQGVLPGFAQRRSVLGLAADGNLYVAIQDAAVPSLDGELPASSYWVTGAIVTRPELGLHTLERDGAPGDIALFLLDNDPCPSTRPNWIPTGQGIPVYDPTKPPMAHEAVLTSIIPENPDLYPGGAMRLVPAAGAAMASEYACLVSWLQRPENVGWVLTAFRNNPPSTDYARGAWVRAGGFLLAGASTGYAGRPVLDVRYNLAWADESGISGEALLLARKARRFYYASAYPTREYAGFPEMTDPMQPGPALGFRLGRFCVAALVGCDPATSPPARDAGVDFYTQSGFFAMSRHPSNTSGGNFVTSFDKSVFPGQEYRGTVFYSTFIGDALMMIPPGLDVGQTLTIR